MTLLSHSVLHTSDYYIIKENEREIKYSTTMDALAHLPFYYNCSKVPCKIQPDLRLYYWINGEPV